jgi:predicted nuclease with TOPRIM domain
MAKKEKKDPAIDRKTEITRIEERLKNIKKEKEKLETEQVLLENKLVELTSKSLF